MAAGDDSDGGVPGGDGDPDGGEPADLPRIVVHVGVAVALTVVGIVAAIAGSIPGVLVGQNTVPGFVLALVGSELGYVVVGAGFLLVTGKELSYLDLDLPGSSRAWGVVAGVVLVAFVFRTVVIVGALSAGVQPSTSTVTQVDLPVETLLVTLAVLSLLVVGPAEELLFRGVVQKFLREVLGAWPAIVGAGLLFGAIHVLALVESTGLGTLVSLAIITLVGFALGWLYEHTGSLPAAMIAHGAYNALIAVSALAFQLLG